MIRLEEVGLTDLCCDNVVLMWGEDVVKLTFLCWVEVRMLAPGIMAIVFLLEEGYSIFEV